MNTRTRQLAFLYWIVTFYVSSYLNKNNQNNANGTKLTNLLSNWKFLDWAWSPPSSPRPHPLSRSISINSMHRVKGRVSTRPLPPTRTPRSGSGSQKLLDHTLLVVQVKKSSWTETRLSWLGETVHRSFSESVLGNWYTLQFINLIAYDSLLLSWCGFNITCKSTF